MIDEFATIASIAREVTVTALLLGGIWALVKGFVVTRFHYDSMEQHHKAVIDFQREIIRQLREN